jgi:hypothetical protein
VPAGRNDASEKIANGYFFRMSCWLLLFCRVGPRCTCRKRGLLKQNTNNVRYQRLILNEFLFHGGKANMLILLSSSSIYRFQHYPLLDHYLPHDQDTTPITFNHTSTPHSMRAKLEHFIHPIHISYHRSDRSFLTGCEGAGALEVQALMFRFSGGLGK